MMKNNLELKVIATLKTDFPTKFGIPRQSGLIPELKAKIVFEPEYRNAEALRGLEGFSHLWLIWGFSQVESKKGWSPTVRPPRLGGNKRVGVFATRSPFRPNPIGLSSVKIERIIHDTDEGPVIEVLGADILNGTPIYDIKPYIAYTDAHIEAKGGFSTEVFENKLTVSLDEKLTQNLSEQTLSAIIKVLQQDPRPAYQEDENRIYAFEFAEYHIEFKVKNNILTVLKLQKS